MATSVLQIVLHSHPNIKNNVIEHATKYIPVIGDQLQQNIHTSKGASVAVIIGILLAFWGAKGLADVFQYSLNHIWHVPRAKRPGFKEATIKSVLVIILVGGGLLAASFLSGFAADLNRTAASRVLPSLVSVIILFGIFWQVIKTGLATSAKITNHALFRSALAAAIGIQVLQIIGGYLITHQLGKLRSAYGAFAATLGLLFWIYLQARIVIYAIEIGTVYQHGLWPRSLTGKNLTEADKKGFAQQAQKEQIVLPEKIKVDFEKNGRGERT